MYKKKIKKKLAIWIYREIVVKFTKVMAKSWRRTKPTVRPISHFGANDGPPKGSKLFKMFGLDMFPNTKYPEIATEQKVTKITI